MSTVTEREIVALEAQRIAATIGGDVATLERGYPPNASR